MALRTSSVFALTGGATFTFTHGLCYPAVNAGGTTVSLTPDEVRIWPTNSVTLTSGFIGVSINNSNIITILPSASSPTINCVVEKFHTIDG